jgi:hypothetical protein
VSAQPKINVTRLRPTARHSLMPNTSLDAKIDTTRSFYRTIAQSVDINMTYLNQTVNWSITIFAGALGAAIVQEKFPNFNTQILLAILLVVISHFFVRCSKAYINVMRYTSLDRYIIAAMALSDYEVAFGAIVKYHVQWVSPLAARTVLYKAFVEFGFIYMWLVVAGLYAYALYEAWSISALVLVIIAHVLMGIEIYIGLIRSPYLAKVEPMEVAERLR